MSSLSMLDMGKQLFFVCNLVGVFCGVVVFLVLWLLVGLLGSLGFFVCF